MIRKAKIPIWSGESMKTIQPPIQKRCKVCKIIKLLNQFDINENVKDKHESICKNCLASHILCSSCVESKIIETAYPTVDLLLGLVRDGTELPEELLKKIENLALLSGMTTYCDGCNKKL